MQAVHVLSGAPQGQSVPQLPCCPRAEPGAFGQCQGSATEDKPRISLERLESRSGPAAGTGGQPLTRSLPRARLQRPTTAQKAERSQPRLSCPPKMHQEGE